MDTLPFDLHRLGWRAFQDLTAVILQTVLGQTFHGFADSNDGGRDGAFHGLWDDELRGKATFSPGSLQGATPVVVQCKFSSSGSRTLTKADLQDELSKVERLHKQGLCDVYIVVTNLRVSGQTDEWLRASLAAVGVNRHLVLDGQWISQQIAKSAALRRYVPRVYGLGDLGQILDERRLEQARVLLSNLGSDLATFVPTAAYRAAADALSSHGFALLLGAPAAGKSTIAAMLATVALDEWKCGVKRVDSPEELLAAWNPHEPDQLFWIDDAFGAIRHDDQLTDQWSRRLDQIMAAVRAGAKVVVTSRDYIYRLARPHLKEYAYPLLRERQVVVNVEELTSFEKMQMLYNHLKAGDQDSRLLASWRRQLSSVAGSQRFQPELARRLGHSAFTSGLNARSDLVAFVERPVDFLRDVLDQLDHGSRAALALVYTATGLLDVPVELSQRDRQTIEVFGSAPPTALQAFQILEGTFLALATGRSGERGWRFRHPTIPEGFAASIAHEPNALEVLLTGMSRTELLREIDCGGAQRGTLIEVPPSLFSTVIGRMPLIDALAMDEAYFSPLAGLLMNRSSEHFVRAWAAVNSEDFGYLTDFGVYSGSSWRAQLLAHLHSHGLIDDDLRRQAVASLRDDALYGLDATWLDAGTSGLFNDSEYEDLLDEIETVLIPNLSARIAESASNYSDDVAPSERYSAAREVVAAYLNAYQDADGRSEATSRLESALLEIDEASADPDLEYDTVRDDSLAAEAVETVVSSRDPFDDVHEGRGD